MLEAKYPPQHPERNRTIVSEVTGEVDYRHPTATQLLLDRIAVGNGSLQAVQRIGHQMTSAGSALQ